MGLYKYFSSIALVPLVVACGGSAALDSANERTPAERTQIRDHIEAVPAAQIQTAFGVEDSYHLVLRKDSLNLEYLLQASSITQSGAPRFTGLKSRIVRFELRPQFVFMFEVSSDHSLDPNFHQDLLLAQFPIVSEDESRVVIDFNSGMRRLFHEVELRFTEDNVKGYSADFRSHSIDLSYLKSARYAEREDRSPALILDQVIRSNEEILRLRYYLQIYSNNPDFERRKSPGLKNVGYVETTAWLNERQHPQAYAAYFNPKRKIRFAVSANTPADYQDAVRDGILYWNKALGVDLIEAVVAPQGVNAPDFHYNIVQWIEEPSEMARLAYADVQMDPRSGEILHAQIYIPAGFAVDSMEKMSDIVHLSKYSGETAQDEVARQSHSHENCGLNAAHLYENAFNGFPEIQGDDSFLKRSAQDFIRHLVAHEVGHTLGLRHNFAGSTEASYHAMEKPEIFGNYIAGLPVPESVVPSSSMMDYLDAEDSVLLGARIREGHPALAHDRVAIRALYFSESTEGAPAYCADSHTDRFLDCSLNDSGNSLVADAKYRFEGGLRSLAYRVVRDLIGQVSWGVPANAAYVNSQKFAYPLVRSRAPIVRALTSDFSAQPKAVTVGLDRDYPYRTPRNQDSFNNEYARRLTEEVDVQGGLDGVLGLLPEGFHEQLMVNLREEVFKQTQGEPSELRDELLEAVSIFASEFKTRYAMNDINLLTNGGDGLALIDMPLNYDFQRLFFERVQHYVFSKEVDEKRLSLSSAAKSVNNPKAPIETEEILTCKPMFSIELASADDWLPVGMLEFQEVEARREVNCYIQLPVYYYSTSVREAALNLFQKNGIRRADWGRRERQRIVQLARDEVAPYVEFINDYLSEAKTDLTDDQLAALDPLSDWLKNNWFMRAVYGR